MASGTVFIASEVLVPDISFVALTLLFFAVAIGYIAACERLMK